MYWPSPTRCGGSRCICRLLLPIADPPTLFTAARSGWGDEKKAASTKVSPDSFDFATGMSEADSVSGSGLIGGKVLFDMRHPPGFSSPIIVSPPSLSKLKGKQGSSLARALEIADTGAPENEVKTKNFFEDVLPNCLPPHHYHEQFREPSKLVSPPVKHNASFVPQSKMAPQHASPFHLQTGSDILGQMSTRSMAPRQASSGFDDDSIHPNDALPSLYGDPEPTYANHRHVHAFPTTPPHRRAVSMHSSPIPHSHYHNAMESAGMYSPQKHHDINHRLSPFAYTTPPKSPADSKSSSYEEFSTPLSSYSGHYQASSVKSSLSSLSPYANHYNHPYTPPHHASSSLAASLSAAHESQPISTAMLKYVYEVRFKRTHRSFTLLSPIMVKKGDHVVVEADRGEDLGVIMSRMGRERYDLMQAAKIGAPKERIPASELKRIIRLATPNEVALLPSKALEETSLLKICRIKALARALPMHVLDAEYQFDRHKLTFFFEAEGRIDFRELVRDLFSIYKTRIWMQQMEKSSPQALETRSIGSNSSDEF